MALTDYKITDGEKSKNQIRSGGAPDRLTGSTDENKQVFDRLALLIALKYNDAVDTISDEFITQKAYIDSIRALVEKEIDDFSGGVTPLVPKGMYDTLAELEEAHPTGIVGDAWLVGDSTSNTAYIWDEDHEEWTDAGGLVDASGFKTAYNKSFESEAYNFNEDGIASAGVLNTIPRADHVHPSDTSKANLISGYVSDDELLDESTIEAWRSILGVS